jgi:hypothetical protein
MPPRFVYWTIVIDGTRTAFRAATREELLPTLKQLQRKTPGAELKWFAHGRLWESPEAVDEERRQRELRTIERPRPSPRPRRTGRR